MRVFYTDGSASPNPGPGGYAVIENGEPVALGGEPGETTNIRMEGRALIAAMKYVGSDEAIIYTDSEFWINVITKWSLGWVVAVGGMASVAAAVGAVVAVGSTGRVATGRVGITTSTRFACGAEIVG